MAPMQYTVTVGRWPFRKTYQVRGHQNEDLGGIHRLVLTLTDGTLVCIPDIARAHVVFGADFATERARIDREHSSQAQHDAAVAQNAINDYRLAEQQRLQAAMPAPAPLRAQPPR